MFLLAQAIIVKNMRPEKNRYLMPVIVIVAWQTLSCLGVISSVRLPSPVEILHGLKCLAFEGMPPGRLLHNHVIHSLYRVSLGYTMAVTVAVPLGLILGWSPGLRLVFSPLIEMIRPIPPLAWIPVSILWFGIGVWSSCVYYFSGRFFSRFF